MKKSLVALFCFLLAACAGPSTQDAPVAGPTYQGQRVLGMLVSFLTGTWETLPGSTKEPMRIRMAEFWKGHANEHWIYAEYVKASDDGHPVRQRIYRFSESDGTINGIVYRVPRHSAGEWRKARPFEDHAPADLREFENCRVIFTRMHEALFAGGTDGKSCRGDRPDVAYERSEWYLSSSSVRNLEQGYDAAGRPTAGEPRPWEFRKTESVAR
jgi:hypothetical protein